DWSSDVCSSDLSHDVAGRWPRRHRSDRRGHLDRRGDGPRRCRDRRMWTDLELLPAAGLPGHSRARGGPGWLIKRAWSSRSSESRAGREEPAGAGPGSEGRRIAEGAAIVRAGHDVLVTHVVAGRAVAVLHPVHQVVPGSADLGVAELAVVDGADRSLHQELALT